MSAQTAVIKSPRCKPIAPEQCVTDDDYDDGNEKMATAELRYEAPLATFDCDEWNEFNIEVEVAPTATSDVVRRSEMDSSTSSGFFSNRTTPSSTCSFSSMSSSSLALGTMTDDTCHGEQQAAQSGSSTGGGEGGNGSGGGGGGRGEGGDSEEDEAAFTGSLEDLVNCFDERIRNCFRNYDEQSNQFAPVQIRTEEEVLRESQ
jgi:hypothetical protein